MPLLYMCTSEKAKPCVSTLSNQPFMMAGTLNQYSGNCESRDTHTHSPVQSGPGPCSVPLPLVFDLWPGRWWARPPPLCAAPRWCRRWGGPPPRRAWSPRHTGTVGCFWTHLKRKKITSYKFSALIHQKLYMFLELHWNHPQPWHAQKRVGGRVNLCSLNH